MCVHMIKIVAGGDLGRDRIRVIVTCCRASERFVSHCVGNGPSRDLGGLILGKPRFQITEGRPYRYGISVNI